MNYLLVSKKPINSYWKRSALLKTIAYSLNNEIALRRFIDNGSIEIDNNAAERALRSVAVGRKNWLFAGSDEGGKTASIIYTLIETAKLNNINPVKYLHKVFDIIQDYKANHIQDLLPWNVKLEWIKLQERVYWTVTYYRDLTYSLQ